MKNNNRKNGDFTSADNEIIFNRISNLFFDSGITEIEFAAKTGLSRSTIRRILGYECLSLATLRAVINYFNTNPNYILGYSDDPSPYEFKNV